MPLGLNFIIIISLLYAFVKFLFTIKHKRIKELEDINEEHRKLNGNLLDINKKFKDWINSLEETDMQDNFVVVRLSDIKNKLKELGGDNENNNV